MTHSFKVMLPLTIMSDDHWCKARFWLVIQWQDTTRIDMASIQQDHFGGHKSSKISFEESTKMVVAFFQWAKNFWKPLLFTKHSFNAMLPLIIMSFHLCMDHQTSSLRLGQSKRSYGADKIHLQLPNVESSISFHPLHKINVKPLEMGLSTWDHAFIALSHGPREFPGVVNFQSKRQNTDYYDFIQHPRNQFVPKQRFWHPI